MGIRVLSLFDGMSCGQLALQKLGIEVDTYYASEIDKYAIQVAKENFPKTIHVGDVCQLKSEDYKDIDLILGWQSVSDLVLQENNWLLMILVQLCF